MTCEIWRNSQYAEHAVSTVPVHQVRTVPKNRLRESTSQRAKKTLNWAAACELRDEHSYLFSQPSIAKAITKRLKNVRPREQCRAR